ncbi:glycosyltransferase family A protein [Chryseobacterium gotjawalense]|uniref:Glycosyltransferase family A protein n=1 Tax=Chryseobacterium gotjawalense TaxID=3042315 RepID=A0ABY8R983_9FLAO|nr:glycosyltransferase family A protein [Chryseobacterium sp. wdc7]WHF50507.1 glycosyltransferase family A protein [Chryseobacterium sp. wdc7]
MNKLVSICIPTYNGARFLQEALDSVSWQTYKNIEVIISDDESADETLQIAEDFKNSSPFPVFIYSHQPAGIGANWDNCIDKANGKWIKFLFQDDILEPNCLEEFIKLHKQTGEEVFFCKRTIIDELGTDISHLSVIADLQKDIFLNFNDYYTFKKEDLKYLSSDRGYLSRNFAGEPVASFVSKKAFLRTGEHNRKLKQLLDLEYNLRLLEKYKLVITAQKLVKFRVHPDQTTIRNWQKHVNEHEKLNDIIIKKFFIYLSRRAILGYYYNKFPLLKNIRGKMPI